MKLSRRRLIQTAASTGVAALTPPMNAATMPGPRYEGKDTPKICLSINDGAVNQQGSPDDAATAASRRLRQLGVEHAITGMVQLPWQEEPMRALLDRYKKNGIMIGNIMTSVFDRAIYNRPGKDEDIEKVIKSIEVAFYSELPVVDYYWYAHYAMEGYFAEDG